MGFAEKLRSEKDLNELHKNVTHLIKVFDRPGRFGKSSIVRQFSDCIVISAPVTNSGLLGHKDMKDTQRYAHLSPDHLANVVDTVCISDDEEILDHQIASPIFRPQSELSI